MNSTFATQIRSAHDNGGDIVLRYGLVQGREESDIEFKFDVDRCTTDIQTEDSLSKLINGYALDIFSLFHTMVGDKLKEWMLLED